MIDKIAELKIGTLKGLSNRVAIDKLTSILADNGYIIVRAFDSYGATYYDIGIDTPDVIYIDASDNKKLKSPKENKNGT